MAKPNLLPDIEYLHECFDLDQGIGRLKWKARPVTHFADERAMKIFNTRFAGRPADGYVSNFGYCQVRIAGRIYLVHRIIWKMVHGTDPVRLLDHVNGVRTDNAPRNLREADDAQNAFNSISPKNSKLKLKGASLHACGKYMSQITRGGKNTYLGLHATPAAAHSAYVLAASKLHGEYACFASARPTGRPHSPGKR